MHVSMFTGLVEGMGVLEESLPAGAGRRLAIVPPEAVRADCAVGDSIAVSGCCLTLVATEPAWVFEAGPETLSRTNLGRLARGEPVNLERALPAGGRLGGHFVQGHIDGLGTVERVERSGDWVTMWFAAPERLTRQMVSKGSVAVDGVSLTLVDVEATRFSVALIPHTLAVTTLGRRAPGDAVNIETDLLAKYVEKLLGGR